MADLIAVDSDCIGMTPMFDVVSHLVYAATGAKSERSIAVTYVHHVY